MTEAVLTVRLTADNRVLSAAIRQANGELLQLGQAGERTGQATAKAGQAGARAMQDTAKAAREARRETGLLSEAATDLRSRMIAAASVAGLAVLGRQLSQTADGYTNLSSKIRLVSESESAALRVRREVLDVANLTRQQLGATGELYVRLTRATENLSLAEAQRLRITETINKSMIVSGASAQEASNAIIQLSQGLASGALRGEEFNSVSEQAPILLDLLSRSLGKTRGELRAMAADGLLTSEVLVGALLEGSAEVDRQFAGMAITISGASTVLGNAFTAYIGEANEAAGVSRAVAGAIAGVADNFELIADVVLGASAAFAVRYVAGVGAAVVAKRQATAAAVTLASATLAEARAAEAASAAQVRHALTLNGARVASDALAAAQARTAAATAALTTAQAANVGVLARMGSSLSALAGGPLGILVLGLGGLAAATLNAVEAEEERQQAFAAGIEEVNRAVEANRQLAEAMRGVAEATPPPIGERIAQQASSTELLAEKQRELADAQQLLNGLLLAELGTRAELSDLQARLAASPDSITPPLREAYQQVQELQVGTDRLRASVAELARANEGALAPAIDLVRERLAELTADSSGGGFARMIDIAAGAAAALREGAAVGERMGQAYREAQGIAAKLKADSDKAAESLASLGKSGSQVAAEQLAAWEAAARASGSYTAEALAAERDRLAANVRTIRSFEDAEAAARARGRAESEAAREAARAIRDQERETRRYALAAREAANASLELARGNQQLADNLEDVRAELAGATPRQLEYARALREAQREYAAALELASMVGPPGPEVEAAYRERVRLLNDLYGASAQLDANYTAEVRRQNDYRAQAWANWIDAAAQASAAFLTGEINSWKDLGKELVSITKRFVQEIIAQLARVQLARIFGGFGGSIGTAASMILGGSGSASAASGLLGGSGSASAASSGGFDLSSASSWTSAGRNLYQGFSQGFSSFTGAASRYAFGNSSVGYYGPTPSGGNVAGGANFMGSGTSGSFVPSTAGYLAAGAAGVYAGYQRYQNSEGGLAGAAGAATYGLATYGAAMGVSSAMAGTGFAAGYSAAFGGAAASGSMAAAAVPVIGWIVAIAAIVDLISGGKLFGTKFRPESAEATLRIAEEGAEAQTELTEVRNRSLFRGRQWRTSEVAPGDEAIEAASALWQGIDDVMQDAARSLQSEAPAMLTAAFRTVQEFDKKGRVKATKYFVDVLGRSWEEASADAALSRIASEAIIKTIDAALGTTAPDNAPRPSNEAPEGTGLRGIEGVSQVLKEFDGDAVAGEIQQASRAMIGEASAIAERWRGDAETLAEGAQFLLAAASDMRRGSGLLGESGSLTGITQLVEDLQRGEESLVETYQRIASATALFDNALQMTGASLDQAREDVVRFAVDIADAAGGLERASALWQSFFDRFYSAAERSEIQRDEFEAYASRQFQEIGLDFGDFDSAEGMQEFRELFEDMLPKLSADAVVQWLEAADALGVFVERQEAYNAAIAESVAAQVEAIMQYEELAQAVRDEAAAGGLSEFALELRDIARWSEDVTAELNAAARAAGFQAAAEEDLAAVHMVAAQRAAAAIARLRSSAASLVEDLYGSPLSRVEAEIARIESAQREAADSQVDAIESVGEAASNVYAAQLSALQGIQKWLDGQALGDLSTLTPEQQIAEAQRQFGATLAAAQGGDAEALQQITGQADALLRLGREFWASTSDYTELEAFVRGALRGLVEAGPSAPAPTPGDSGSSVRRGGGGAVAVTASPQLQALYEERDRLMAEQEAARRASLVAELGQQFRELIQATRDPLGEVASSIGLNLRALATDLGVELDQVGGDTARGLVAMARQLGVEVAELAEEVGVSLGGLGDRQSLLNEALDDTVGGIPQEFQERLRAPLEAIRNATSEADAREAIAEAEAAINAMPPAIRDLLAPFFDAIDPSAVVSELGTLRDISERSATQIGLLQGILSALTAKPENAKPAVNPGPGGGTIGGGGGPELGKGAVLAAPFGEFAAPAASTPPPAAVYRVGDESALLAEVRALNESTERREREMLARLKSLEAAQVQGAAKIAAEQRRASDALMARR